MVGAAGPGPGASRKYTQALGKATRQLFPGAPTEGRPPVGAIILGSGFFSVPLNLGLTWPQYPHLARPSRKLPMQFPLPGSPIPHDILLADSFPSLHTASGKPANPRLGQLLCSHRPACRFCTRCSGFTYRLTSVAPLDHKFHKAWELASLGPHGSSTAKCPAEQNKSLAVKIQGGKDLATLQAPLGLVRAMRVTTQLKEKQADQHPWGMLGLGVR